ncbi:MAG: dolichol kinase [Synechococcus sp. MED-G71]|nr:MAG: dolichol kinase [Synechococcus sp. MED-G71]RPF78094.1 MAG: dolichol kinase [Synechococcus sp. TMED155]
MSPAFGILLAGLWLAAVLAAALGARRIWPQQRELSRKLVHMGAGLTVPLAWWLQIPRPMALLAAALATAAAIINHRAHLLPAVEDVGRRSAGTIAYGLSITVLIAWGWPERADLVSAAVLVMALGDGAAGLVGSSLSSPRWQLLGQSKSLLGTAVMAAMSLLVLALLLDGLSWPALLALSGAATALEQLSWGGLDNLTVPLGVAGLGAGLGA